MSVNRCYYGRMPYSLTGGIATGGGGGGGWIPTGRVHRQIDHLLQKYKFIMRKTPYVVQSLGPLALAFREATASSDHDNLTMALI